MSSHEEKHGSGMAGSYRRLFLALTMAFVAQGSHFYLNLSNFYMAVMMVAPMGLIMLFVMRNMFANPRLNAGLVVSFVVLFFAAFWIGRAEVLVGNEQFLRAMIPHHSRAILVCESASITDVDIQELCQQIIATQKEEIDIMQRMLDER